MAFNIVARNQDDHVKNIAFLMTRSGTWSLAPAFDFSEWESYARRTGVSEKQIRAISRSPRLRFSPLTQRSLRIVAANCEGIVIR